MNWKGFGRKQLWPNFKVLFRHSPRETEESSIRIAGRRGRDLNLTALEYEAEMLTTRP
jgi:hypothetical protein